MSHAYLLQDGSSVEIVIPEHLEPLRRHLESFAYRMRRNAREDNKSKVSTQIRMKDEDMSLVLAVKTAGEDKWSQFTREELRKEDEENRRLEEEEEGEEDGGSSEGEEESEQMTS